MPAVESYIDGIARGAVSPLSRPLRGVLWLVSVAYRGLIAVRNARYDLVRSSIQHVTVPVISIGNITTGGTGKTPMVVDIVSRLQGMGRRPAVVSRGYKAADAGCADELALIERAAPGTPCVANPDRVAGAEQAVADHGADVVVLDDGFQHRRLGRDLDVVLIDATRPFGFGHLLPRGLLREPIANLARADMFIVTRVDQAEAADLEALRRRLEALAVGRPILTAVHCPLPLSFLWPDSPEAQACDGGPAFLLSGIGNHDAFRRTVDSLDVAVCGHARFTDHHRFRAAELRNVCADAAAHGATRLIVTEKDAVKLERLGADWPLPVQVLGVRIDFCDHGGKIMDRVIQEVMGGAGADGAAKVPTSRS